MLCELHVFVIQKFTKDSPLVGSGLLGPVSILQAE